jgi:hypothetical protein
MSLLKESTCPAIIARPSPFLSSSRESELAARP